MKKLTLLITLFLLNIFVFAENEIPAIGTTDSDSVFKSREIVDNDIWTYIDPKITAVISVNDYVKLWETITLDATSSLIMNNKKANYKWLIDWITKTWEKAEITFDKLWKKKISLIVTQWNEISNIEKDIIVFRKKALFVTDKDSESWLTNIIDQAALNWVWLKVLNYERDYNLLTDKNNLINNFSNNFEFINSSQILFFDTKDIKWLEIFIEFLKKFDPLKQFSLNDKLLVKISEWNLNIDLNIIHKFFEILNTSNILITRKEALNPIFETEESILEIEKILQNRVIEYTIANAEDQKNSFLVLSNLVTSLISKWVPLSTIYLLLAFPFVALFIVFVRQFIWFSAFWIYLPAVISLTFFVIGLQFWLILLLSILLISYLVRQIIERIELPFIPKSSLMLTSVFLSFLFLIWIFLELKINLAISAIIFPMIIMSRISEKFLWAQLEEWSFYAFISTFQTIATSVAAFLFVNFVPLNNLIISLPEIVILPLILNVIIWKYQGLRITEYFKFKDLLKDWMQE